MGTSASPSQRFTTSGLKRLNTKGKGGGLITTEGTDRSYSNTQTKGVDLERKNQTRGTLLVQVVSPHECRWRPVESGSLNMRVSSHIKKELPHLFKNQQQVDQDCSSREVDELAVANLDFSVCV